MILCTESRINSAIHCTMCACQGMWRGSLVPFTSAGLREHRHNKGGTSRQMSLAAKPHNDEFVLASSANSPKVTTFKPRAFKPSSNSVKPTLHHVRKLLSGM